MRDRIGNIPEAAAITLAIQLLSSPLLQLSTYTLLTPVRSYSQGNSRHNGSLPVQKVPRHRLRKHHRLQIPRQPRQTPIRLVRSPIYRDHGSWVVFLTPATAIRYEKHDRRVQRLSKEEELGIGKNARKVDMKEEYYVCGTQAETRKEI